jgi:hypothetical protein
MIQYLRMMLTNVVTAMTHRRRAVLRFLLMAPPEDGSLQTSKLKP